MPCLMRCVISVMYFLREVRGKLVVIAMPIGALQNQTIDDFAVFVTLCTIRHGKIERTIGNVLLGECAPFSREVSFDVAIAQDVVVACVVFQHKFAFTLVENSAFEVALSVGRIGSSTRTSANDIEIGHSFGSAS